jgi:hypothetical protein
MKIRLSMSGRDSTGHAKLKRTVTEEEFAAIFALVAARDGKRPWDSPSPCPGEETADNG